MKRRSRWAPTGSRGTPAFFEFGAETLVLIRWDKGVYMCEQFSNLLKSESSHISREVPNFLNSQISFHRNCKCL